MRFVKSFLKELENSKRKQLFFFCISMFLIVTGYAVLISKIKIDKYLEFTKVEDDLSWVFQVEDIYESEKDFVIEGWAFGLWKDAYQKAYDIILYDIESDKGYFPEMQYCAREDINEYFLCEYNYLQSGFSAHISMQDLELNEQIFEILIRPAKSKKAYSTGIYIADGKLMYTNPKKFMSPEVDGTDLQEIVENGILRIYRPNEGMYVYQYENQLYWIADAYYAFNESGDTYIQWHLETSQVENLPQYRLENNWHFDNLGFDFCENELKEWNTGRYRVARKELPVEYSIIRMNTGRHEDGWIWKEDFRPYYEFQK